METSVFNDNHTILKHDYYKKHGLLDQEKNDLFQKQHLLSESFFIENTEEE